MGRARIVFMSCVVISLLCAVPRLAGASDHFRGYEESRSGTNKRLCASELGGSVLPETGYIGIWADQAHSDCDASPALYGFFDAWIWCLPTERGLKAAEFAVSFPAIVVITSIVKNPDITTEIGSLAAGTSVEYGACQNDWTWTHHLTCIILATIPDVIRIIPHPGMLPEPEYHFANCETGFPIEPCLIYTNLYINQSCFDAFPTLSGVVVESPLSLRASVSGCVDFGWTATPLSHFFKLRNVADPTDSILVVDAEETGSFLLVLEKQMTVGTEYALEAFLCGCCASGCEPSEWEFLYSGGFEPFSNLGFAFLSSSIRAPDICASPPVEFTIANNGGVPADSFDVELACIYRWWPLHEEVVSSKRYAGLDAGEMVHDAFGIPPRYFEAEDYREFRIRIDAPEETGEWAELDNTRNVVVTNDNPCITSIVDEPGDTGGAVRIAFLRSYFEYRNQSLLNSYSILRRIGQSDSWESVVRLPGTGASSYSAIAPTSVDSTGSSGDYWFTYKVQLESVLNTIPTDTVYHSSCPDSGYSVDNIGTTATFLQSCSASFGGTGIEIAWELSEADAGIEFFVSRSESGADFLPLDMTRLARNDLTFTYVDSRVEPGKGYVYKVEYTIDGKSRLLFITEEIRTPAALLALHQNRPNPFNPSTTISFTLPVESAVRLEVYDVSGRLVARLIDNERLSADVHNVEWNGRDVSGRSAASGIYVYRLIAGKETISRKMVLLR